MESFKSGATPSALNSLENPLGHGNAENPLRDSLHVSQDSSKLPPNLGFKDNRPPAAESSPSVTPESTPHENKAKDTEAESPSYSGPSQNKESSSYQVTHPEEDDVEETDQDRQEQANTDQEESNEDKGVETEESIRKKEMDDLITKRSQVLVLAHGKKNAPLDGENKPPSWVDKWVKPGFAWLKTQFAKGWNYVVSTLCKHKPLSTEPGPIANFFLIKTAPFHPREPRDFLTARLIQRELLKPLLRDHQMEPPLAIPPPAAKETSS
ncbi:hypothetical protein PCANC_09675 [Puccinia coronata f. sp. avenae]|uniref:Uncharacterized protein n=1 Tax=Puccinia coronata f. sp. avenae TaxID=200324 RepID=A0A2N5VB29_9BASI|nr:hypothetical protein PCANC_09675 [Puccinia coronata f. sp. avenae]